MKIDHLPIGSVRLNPANPRQISEITRARLSASHRGLKYPSCSGPNHHNWKGGITGHNEKIRKSADYKNWRLYVFKRDKYTCQECGVVGGYLHAHHIEKFSEKKNLQFDINNGKTLCMNCHAKIHGLTISKMPQNKCPKCGKKIKPPNKLCMACVHERHIRNLNKCVDCGVVIKRESKRCRSCAAKKRMAGIGYVNFWEYKNAIS